MALDGEGSYIVGPAQGSGEWWGGWDAAGVVERYCQMDDEFIFYDDGTFVIDTQGDVWAEGYMGGNNECLTDESLVAPFDVFGRERTRSQQPVQKYCQRPWCLHRLQQSLELNRLTKEPVRQPLPLLTRCTSTATTMLSA